jgi:hypothetical protein
MVQVQFPSDRMSNDRRFNPTMAVKVPLPVASRKINRRSDKFL